MTVTEPFFYKPFKAYEQDKVFLSSLIHGVDTFGYKCRISTKELSWLRADLRQTATSGNKYSAKTGYGKAKGNQERAKSVIDEVIPAIQTIRKGNLNQEHVCNQYLRGYSMMLAVESAELKQDDNGFWYFSDELGRNVYRDVILKARSIINSKLAEQCSKVKKSIVGSPFSIYGMSYDVETVIKNVDGRAVSNPHAHINLMIDTKIDLDKFIYEVNQLLIELKVSIQFNAEPLLINYGRRGAEHDAVINLNWNLKSQIKAIKPFLDVANYNHKQEGFPNGNREIKDFYGQGTGVSQSDEFKSLPVDERAKSVLAIANGTYGLHLHEFLGVFRNAKASELIREGEMYQGSLNSSNEPLECESQSTRDEDFRAELNHKSKSAENPFKLLAGKPP